jgi:transposase-like protein
VAPKNRSIQKVITTQELARQIGVTPRAIYQGIWKYGHYYGIVPERGPLNLKFSAYAWPTDAPAKIIAARRDVGRGVSHG